ncbi:hypothetical protein IV203_014439 [Nitzschia inconspicua]|uniref:Uncharacterized protein n=1 Tax=Nitzschia inconspicua TaxID=303405 RepID=A0A9K3PSD0_9STRA|nr:hypothetical protein IV203_014439 [Nitzschia inconspicua]
MSFHYQCMPFLYFCVVLILCIQILSTSVSGANEYRDDKYIEYGDVLEDYPAYHDHRRPVCSPDDTSNNEQRCLNPSDFVLNEFFVAGINLARYNNNRHAVPAPKYRHFNEYRLHTRPFLLYHDFDIGDKIQGNETWMDLILIRRHLQRPSISFYSDKVARKRWLKERGYPQPFLFYSEYRDLLTPKRLNASQEELAQAILPRIPTTHGFCAKPNHMSMTMGNWLVDIDPYQKDRPVKFSRTAKQLRDDQVFDSRECADSLAHGLLREAATIESFALKNIRPGFVVEELISNHEDRSLPPHEFCIFVVWGRVYIAQWNSVEVTNRYLDGFIYRDGSIVPGCDFKGTLPEWVPWNEMVMMAESLATGKDMFRVDFLVGVPRYSPPGTAPRAVLSECAFHTNTQWCNSFMAEELVRLWIAGYKIGNYHVVENPEIPPDFLSKAQLYNLNHP